MKEIHLKKSELSWSLLSQITAKKIKARPDDLRRSILVGDREFFYTDWSAAHEYADVRFLVTTTSDRALPSLLTEDLFQGKPYISACLLGQETPVFRKLPSLVQAKLIIQAAPENILYTSPTDISSPSLAYQKEGFDPDIFRSQLDHQSSLVQEKKATELTIFHTEDPATIAHHIREAERIATASTEANFREQGMPRPHTFIKKIGPTPLAASPIYSVDRLFALTEENTPMSASLYNEVIITKKTAHPVSIAGILMTKTDLEHLSSAAEAGNEDALTAVTAIIGSGLPVIVVRGAPDPELASSDSLPLRIQSRRLAGISAIISATTDRLILGHSLQQACFFGDHRLVDLLLANPHTPIDFDTGMPLKAAAFRGHARILQQLIEAGADCHSHHTELLTYIDKRRASGHYRECQTVLQRYSTKPHPDADSTSKPAA
jgi:hypothetical protein